MAALNCTTAAGKKDVAVECALKAFSDKIPFYVRFYLQHDESFGYEGFAGDADGNLYGVKYFSGRWGMTGYLPKEAKILDGYHTFVMPCPKPTILTTNENGNLTCVRPVV